MSMYDQIFGVNPHGEMLMRMLQLQPFGPHPVGRFRDIYLNGDGTKIILYTRNGGGNREQHQWVFDKLKEHPYALRDWDDEFDSTYAYVEFKVPAGFEQDMKDLASGIEPPTVSDRFKALVEDMKADKDTPEVRRAKKLGARIFSEVEKGGGGAIGV